MYFLVDDNPDMRFDDAESVAEYCYDEDNVSSDDFDEYLDDCFESIDICGETYSPSTCLYGVDEDRYNSLYEDWVEGKVSSEREDITYELNRLSDGDTYDIANYTIYVYEEDGEEESVVPSANVTASVEDYVKRQEILEQTKKEQQIAEIADFASLFTCI